MNDNQEMAGAWRENGVMYIHPCVLAHVYGGSVEDIIRMVHERPNIMVLVRGGQLYIAVSDDWAGMPIDEAKWN